MKQFYAYIYRHNNVPFYVGKGTGNRVYSHLTSKKNTHFINRVRMLIANGTPPTIEIINALNEEHAKFLEICLIELIGRADLGNGPLLNLTNGGDGRTEWSCAQKACHSAKMTGQKRTEDTKRLMKKAIAEKMKSPSERMKRAKNFGSPEGTGQKKGAVFSDEHKEKLAKAQTGKRHSEETKRKIAQSRAAANQKKDKISA